MKSDSVYEDDTCVAYSRRQSGRWSCVVGVQRARTAPPDAMMIASGYWACSCVERCVQAILQARTRGSVRQHWAAKNHDCKLIGLPSWRWKLRWRVRGVPREHNIVHSTVESDRGCG